MAEQSYVWEIGGGGDESPHSVAAWGRVEAALVGVRGANEGVLPRYGSELAVSTISGATQVRMLDGAAFVDGHPYLNTATIDVTPVTPAVGTTGRRLVLRCSWAAQTVRLIEISSPDGTATIPDLTQVSGTTYDIPICRYTVTTGGAIAAFIDEREFAGGARWIEITKAADETVNNSNTLQNDDDFVFAAEANSVYLVELDLFLTSAASPPDFKIAFALPSGGSGATRLFDGSASVSVNLDATASDEIDTTAIYVGVPTRVWARITIGATAGNVQFQWAQETADMSNSSILKGSMMRCRKVA